MASSSSATIHKARRYDVFLSFRGEVTRNGFTSHLHEALCKNQILSFIDNLERGDDISASLLTTIEESTISLIIFTENYADSRWCLKELAKIIQCKHLNGQLVIPVFYGVNPSDVRGQSGNFGVAFDKLKERLREGEMDLNEVRSHLVEAADLSGWNSEMIRPESKLIKCIVLDILSKLNLSSNKPNSTMTLWENMEDRNVMKYLQNNNDISWGCQFCGHPFPWEVQPKTFRHHLTRMCESVAQRREEEAVEADEFSASVEGSRTASTSVASYSVAKAGKEAEAETEGSRYDQGAEVQPETFRHHFTRMCGIAPEDVKEAAQRTAECSRVEGNWEPRRIQDAPENDDSNFEVEAEVSSLKRTRREVSSVQNFKP